MPLGEARSAASVSTNGSAAHEPEGGFHETNRLFAALSTLPFGGVLAQAPAETAAKGTLVAEHELPNVPGKSLRAVLVEYGPGAGSPSDRHPSSAFIDARAPEGAIRAR